MLMSCVGVTFGFFACSAKMSWANTHKQRLGGGGRGLGRIRRLFCLVFGYKTTRRWMDLCVTDAQSTDDIRRTCGEGAPGIREDELHAHMPGNYVGL